MSAGNPEVDLDADWRREHAELHITGEDVGDHQRQDNHPRQQHQHLHHPEGPTHGHAGAHAHRLTSVSSAPTVLTKLQKWGDYASVGAQVLPTKFIPMKTPLSAEILSNWSLPSQPKHRLTVGEMVAQQAALGRKIGLLLDLSNHDCLYTADIPPDLRYLHIQLVAKELPPQDFVDRVVGAANAFWSERPDEYIAVHCAYGFNRTGFVVCCYLIEVCGLSVEDALASFAASRPPGVKHEQFRNELHRRYSGLGHHAASEPALYGGGVYGVYGSPPEENSSFGCSPSCGSLELRDLGYSGGGSGPSPMPLTRGCALDAVGVVMHAPSPAGARHSLEEAAGGRHQTHTFTSSSVAVDCGLRRGDGGCGEAGRQQQQRQQREQARTATNRLHKGHACTTRTVEAEAEQVELRRGQQPSAGTAHGPRSDGVQPASAPGEGPSSSACRQDGGGGSIDLQQGPFVHPDYTENESLGVNDRFILQTLRQHALAHAHSTIAEESGSYASTPLRGCSSNSLVDSGNVTGHSTPAAGKYSRRSVEAIDWAAAMAAEDADVPPEPQAATDGPSVDGLVSDAAALKLSCVEP